MTDEPKQFDRKRAVGLALRHHMESRRSRAEVELEWYASEGCSLFERSAQGGQLRAMMLASSHQKPCPKCCGHRRMAFCEQEAKAFDRAKAAGVFHLMPPARIKRGIHVPGYTPDGFVCRKCGGSGTVEAPIERSKGPVDARPTGHEVRDHGYEVPGHLMERYAQVTRWLMRVGEPWADVLSAYYGPDATRCITFRPWSAYLAIMPLTVEGGRLLDTCTPTEGESLHPILRMCRIARAQETDPKPWRLELLSGGYDHARGLLDNALEAFGLEMEK